MEAAPAIYFETDHYKGWAAVLVRLAKIGDKELQFRVAQAWKAVAPRKDVAVYEAAAKSPAAKKPAKPNRVRRKPL